MYAYTGTRLVLIPSFIEEKSFGKMANFMISCTERMKLLAIVYKSYKIIIASIDMIVINVRVPEYRTFTYDRIQMAKQIENRTAEKTGWLKKNMTIWPNNNLV